MASTNHRELNADEVSHIRDVLSRLRNHFREWPGYEGNEHELVGFAFYEECGDSSHCGEILAEAAPLALGQELVVKHGFEWAMTCRSDGTWGYTVKHPNLDSLIELNAIEGGQWNDKKYHKEPCPGETTYDSLEFIIKRASGKNVRTRKQ